jgi:hypothetical protein
LVAAVVALWSSRIVVITPTDTTPSGEIRTRRMAVRAAAAAVDGYAAQGGHGRFDRRNHRDLAWRSANEPDCSEALFPARRFGS